MLIEELRYHGGLHFVGKIIFDKRNFIVSENNIAGKTTILRTLLYGLGFKITMTNGVANLDLDTVVRLITDSSEKIEIHRFNKEKVLCKWINDSKEKEYKLPDDQKNLHSIIFNTKTSNLLDNCLGTFYFEQGRGYSLINYGVVTPKNHFSLKELMNELTPEVEDKIKELDTISNRLNQEITATEAIEKIIKNSADSLKDKMEDSDELTNQNINGLQFKLQQLKEKEKRVKESLKDNKKVMEYISELRLKIKLKNGDKITVTPDNILYYSETNDFLKGELRYISDEIDRTKNKLEKHKKIVEEKYKKGEKNFISHIAKSVSSDQVQASLAHLKRQNNEIKNKKSMLYKKHDYQELQNRLYKLYSEYATKLEIKDWMTHGIFSSKNVSGLTGTEQEFTAISIRLAALKLVEEYTGNMWPIILDSPFQELTPKNKRNLVDFLQTEFGENHQIIIATVYSEISEIKTDKWNIISI